MISFRLLSGLFAILLAYVYMKRTQLGGDDYENLELSVRKAWTRMIKPPAIIYKRVAIGVNANVDLIVRAVDLLKELGVTPGDRIDHTVLDNFEHLQNSFHFHFSRGGAVERTFTDQAAFIKIIEAANRLENVEWSVGGNAALMAEVIANTFSGTNVELIAPIGPRLKEMLYKGVSVPAYSYHPDDEIHLIMEYTVGEKWGRTTAPTANRYITSNDETNAIMSHMEAFFSSFHKSHPQLVILSGCHLLEMKKENVWRDRLQRLIRATERIPKDAPIHLEMASMANPIFMGYLLDNVIPKMNAIGLNEQELSFASFSSGGPHFDLITAGNAPPVHKVTDILVWLLRKYGYSLNNQASTLTRIHFHSLTYHIIAVVKGKWFNLKSAVAAGTNIAGMQACGSKQRDIENFELRIPRTFQLSSHEDYRNKPVTFNASEPVIIYDVQGYQFYLSPVLVCKKPLKTVGVGDAISSMALFYSNFHTQL